MQFPETSNAAVNEAFVTAVFAGDHDTITRLAHRDFELHEGSGVPFAGIYRGAAGFIAFLQVFAEIFDIKRLEPVGSYSAADPDKMAFQFELEAIVRQDGRAFVSSLVETWQFKDRQVVKIVAHYFNSPFHH